MAKGKQEVEIKFRANDLKALTDRLRKAGFRLKTRRTIETNTLFDNAQRELSARREVLRIRRYGEAWTLTHKSGGTAGRHKSRVETETVVADGEALTAVFASLGFQPSFRYEKFRSEWTDGKGHVVLDETPIGNFGEIEGSAAWIDRTARTLGVTEQDYITASYAGLFFDWKEKTGSPANEMTWKAITGRNKR
ncbi:MAG TPA: class IV adenylate cyclase [Terriglobales bacterium]|nr:class IV adenylate cyclase [Terriglobales bacterium]